MERKGNEGGVWWGVGLWLAAKSASTFHKSACAHRARQQHSIEKEEGERGAGRVRSLRLPPAANPGYLLNFNNIINERLSGEYRVSIGGPFDLC